MEASRAAEPRARTPLRQAIFKPRADRAFEQLYQRHAREVYQYALALLANPADAEDVTQTTFLNAYRAFQKGERPHKPHNWLITITHNVCRMRWRQAGSRPREVALDEAPEPTAHDDEQPNLDEVLTALAGLSFNQRAAIVMRELEGRSYQEISGVLGVSVSAVEALLFRARRNLQLRRGLGVLTTVPLPGSLASFVGGGGGAVVAGGAAVGADLVLKAAAVIAVGAASVGVGYAGIKAVKAPHQAAAPLVAPKPASTSHRAPAHTQPLRRPTAARAKGPKLRRAVATPHTTPVSQPVAAPGGSLTAPQQSAPPPPPPPPPSAVAADQHPTSAAAPADHAPAAATAPAAAATAPAAAAAPASATAPAAPASDQITPWRGARSAQLRHLLGNGSRPR